MHTIWADHSSIQKHMARMEVRRVEESTVMRFFGLSYNCSSLHAFCHEDPAGKVHEFDRCGGVLRV